MEIGNVINIKRLSIETCYGTRVKNQLKLTKKILDESGEMEI